MNIGFCNFISSSSFAKDEKTNQSLCAFRSFSKEWNNIKKQNKKKKQKNQNGLVQIKWATIFYLRGSFVRRSILFFYSSFGLKRNSKFRTMTLIISPTIANLFIKKSNAYEQFENHRKLFSGRCLVHFRPNTKPNVAAHKNLKKKIFLFGQNKKQ